MNNEQERSPFILGNTQDIGFTELRDDYLVPVFSRDNVECISHNEFISTTMDAAQTFFQGEQFVEPQSRVAHKMTLRTRAGAGKLVENLRDEDSEHYFQRMAFMIEIPSISFNVNGNQLNLQITGVRSYHETNLLGNSSQKQMFRLGIGLLNTVCTNLCLSTDGIKTDIKVTNTADLYRYAMELFSRYTWAGHIDGLKRLEDTVITIDQLAQFLGKARLYSALSQSAKTEMQLPELILNEAQLNAAVRDYYSDEHFGGYGEPITGWKFYNLLTNYKNNYLDTAIERSVNAFDVATGVCRSINGTDNTWDWFVR